MFGYTFSSINFNEMQSGTIGAILLLTQMGDFDTLASQLTYP
jgi:hypothetical protein